MWYSTLMAAPAADLTHLDHEWAPKSGYLLKWSTNEYGQGREVLGWDKPMFDKIRWYISCNPYDVMHHATRPWKTYCSYKVPCCPSAHSGKSLLIACWAFMVLCSKAQISYGQISGGWSVNWCNDPAIQWQSLNSSPSEKVLSCNLP